MTRESLLTRMIKVYLSSLFPVAILLTPFRIIFDFFTIHHPDLFRAKNNLKKHREKVGLLQKQVLEWNKSGRKKKLCTARPAWQTLSVRSLQKGKFTQISVNELEDIIEIDTKNKILRVEPGMKMGTLTHKILPLGWTIPVLPEFETLTIGGCINGTGIESGSHLYGLFNDICVEYDVLMASGEIVTCSKDQNPDLFYAIPWSHGTIGFLTSVSIQIIPAPKYVKVEYFSTDSIKEAESLLQQKGFDFIEGLAFDIDKYVVMHGTLTSHVESKKINKINSWYKPWFFKHVESIFDKGSKIVEYIPIKEYYHRHQRSYFWEIPLAIPYGNNPVFRYLFGWIFPMNFQMMKYLIGAHIWDMYFTVNHVLQDFMIPIGKLEECLKFSHKEVKIYPIWLCPCKFFKTPGGMVQPASGKDEMYIDIGIYGTTPLADEFEPREKIRKFEKFTIDNKGYQFLYADTYMTREEFRKMFSMAHYDKVRKEYGSEAAFPDVYDKISKSARGG